MCLAVFQLHKFKWPGAICWLCNHRCTVGLSSKSMLLQAATGETLRSMDTEAGWFLGYPGLLQWATLTGGLPYGLSEISLDCRLVQDIALNFCSPLRKLKVRLAPQPDSAPSLSWFSPFFIVFPYKSLYISSCFDTCFSETWTNNQPCIWGVTWCIKETSCPSLRV